MKPLFPEYHIGHFLNQPNDRKDFAITRFETMEEPEVDDPHQHIFYEILWAESGKSTQVIDYQSYEIGPGSLFFISPGQVHHFEDWQHLRGGSIFFTADFFLLNSIDRSRIFDLIFLDNRYISPQFTPQPADFQTILHTIHLMESENILINSSLNIQQSYLNILLEQIQRSWKQAFPVSPPTRSLSIFKQFKSVLDIHFSEAKSAAWYADQLHITQHHLNSIVQQIAGKTTTDAIRERVMLEARRLLTFTDLTATEIAHSLQLTDSSWFAKRFRKETGLSPTDFRKSTAKTYRNMNH